MTESQWLACADPVQMIEAIGERGSQRKFRLFAVAGCYLCPPRTGDPEPQFEIVVRYADGGESADVVRKEWGGVATGQSWPERPYAWAHEFASCSLRGAHEYPATADLAALLRDIFGNPFRPVTLDPAWLTSDVLALARGIYEDRAFDRMPILADALQDAGCDNEELLAHCRAAKAAHVRGCWAIDLVLGKA